MSNGEKKLVPLDREELREVKGGLPYEMPILIELSGGLQTCGVGRMCSGGSTESCSDGSVCIQGGTGPDPDPNPT